MSKNNQLRRAVIGIHIAVLTLFYPLGAYTFAEGTEPPAPLETAAETAQDPPVAPTAAPADTAETLEAQEPTIPETPVAKSEAIEVVNSDTDTATYTFDTAQTVGVTNTIASTAQSGDAVVSHNTTAGSAQTGDALAMATVLNLLQSSTSLTGQASIATFQSDIVGDVFGDLLIDPSVLAAVQGAGGVEQSSTDVTMHTDINGQITNDISLDVGSGDAAVLHNSAAGNAASGTATAVANVVNIMNSAIGSGKSFLGFMNIYGNLNGDILLPPGALDTLLASNAPATATEAKSIQAQTNDSQNITNNITATARSGDAAVDDNTTAGSATTGTSETKVTILNLTNKQVVAANSLLVFVNVAGKWVGAIMNAPEGSTSAALASSVAQNTCDACSADYTTNTTQTITNNISVNAQSGNATVQGNDTAGSARSGNAKAHVNVANIMNSTFSLADWFGVLFVNVFGTWNGSFGIDTVAGELPDAPSGGGSSVGAETPQVQVFRFASTADGSHRLQRVASTANGASDDQPPQPQVLATTDEQSPPLGGAEQSQSRALTSLLLFPALGLLIGSLLLGLERLIASRQRRRSARILV